MTAARILHLHSSFDLGGKERRAVDLMNGFGAAARHVVLSAVPGALGAAQAIAPGIDVTIQPAEAPPLHGKPGPRRYVRLARYMAGFDLVLSYNWGAMDGVMAHRLFGRVMRLPPLIHHEDGFNADEVARRSPLRNNFRAVALVTATRLAVPSRTLEDIARGEWRQPVERIARIPNGIATARYAAPPVPDAIPGLVRRPGETLVGTIAGLRAVKNLPRLVRAVAAAGEGIRLVVVGEGPERAAIVAAAERLGVGDRLVMPGFLADPHRYVGLFDIFALSSDSEQFPISMVEAMAASLPVAAPAVGDIAHIASAENRPFIAPPGDEAALAAAIRTLAADAGLRRTVGAANRALAIRAYDEAAMREAYRALYAEAMRKPGWAL